MKQKCTDNQQVAIERVYRKYGIPQKELGNVTGTSQATISRNIIKVNYEKKIESLEQENSYLKKSHPNLKKQIGFKENDGMQPVYFLEEYLKKPIYFMN